MHGQVHVAAWPDAAELGRDVMDHGLAPVVELGLAEIPLLRVTHHGVQLVNRGDESELRVLEHLGVSELEG